MLSKQLDCENAFDTSLGLTVVMLPASGVQPCARSAGARPADASHAGVADRTCDPAAAGGGEAHNSCQVAEPLLSISGDQ